MDKYLLAPYVSCGFYKEDLDIGFGSILITVKEKIDQEAYLKSCCFIKTPRTLSEFKEFIFNETSSNNKELIYASFIDKNFLIKEDFYDPNDRYSRDHLYYNLSGADPRAVQKKLALKHVVILGCGGIGNIIAVNLATSGIGKLTLVDNDHIELSNLTRQILFCETDVGHKKTTILKKALLSRNNHVSIDTLDVMFDSPEKIKNLPTCDLIVASGDSDNICIYLNKYSLDNNIPFINVGYIQDIACWGPFIIPEKTACFECFSYSNIANQENDQFQFLIKSINEGYKAPSFGAINILASASATLDIIKYLGDFGEIQSLQKRIGIWTDTLKIEHQTYQQNPDCALCAQKRKVARIAF